MPSTTTLYSEVLVELQPELVNSPPVGGSRCGHSFTYFIVWNTTFCGLCFLQEGYLEELPGRMHFTKRTLADNGNPQQTGKLMAHVQVIEGIHRPKPGEPLEKFRLTREQLYGKPPRNLFPFASSLWDLMGYQPPLAEPLAYAVVGLNEFQIAAKMSISVYRVVERISKAIPLATRNVRKYSDRAATKDDRSASRSSEHDGNEAPEPGSRTRHPHHHKKGKRARHR